MRLHFGKPVNRLHGPSARLAQQLEEGHEQAPPMQFFQMFDSKIHAPR
jgi:hypothetical protein